LLAADAAMIKRKETPSQRAIRRLNQWVRTNKSGTLHKVPGFNQAQLLTMLALAGVVDNDTPRGVLTGRTKEGKKTGLGPTVESISTITRMSRRWAGETLFWLSQPIGDVHGQPLDLRGDSAPSGGRVTHECEVVFYVPFILIAPGGEGGGRRNRMWLHNSFYDGTDEEFDLLKELQPWPYDPRLNGNSVPIQMGTGKALEWELSSQKPSRDNTPGAALPVEEPTSTHSSGERKPTCVVASGDACDCTMRVEVVAVEAVALSFSSTGSAAPAVLELQKVNCVQDAGQDGRERQHAICHPGIGARDQFRFLVEQLSLHGINSFDLMAPDRVFVDKGHGAKESKNVGWRWTHKDAEGRRQNTKFGEQAAFDISAEQVLVEFDRSLPSILTDRVGARGKPTLGRDFYWRAARGHLWPLIVLDDVDVARLPACRRFVLQTSDHKFQALLLCDESLHDDGRHRLQSYYVRQTICDPGASGGIQPVRPPGSINRKPERNSFVTRLIEAQLDAPLLNVKEIRDQLGAAAHVAWKDMPAKDAEPAPTTAPSTILIRRSSNRDTARRSRTDHSPSGEDLSIAMRMLKNKSGHSSADAEVHSWIVSSAVTRGKKAEATRYADTTLFTAKYALAHDGQLPETPGRAARRASK
jgi:RepB DNA-primase from phage plasmid